MEDEEGKTKKIPVSLENSINEELCDLYYKQAARVISDKLRFLKASFDERKNKTTVAEYKAFVQMMPQLQKERAIVTSHSDLCKLIMSKPNQPNITLIYEALLNPTASALEKIWTGEVEVSCEEALKILCLSSWRLGGFKAKDFENHKNEFLSIYGFDKLKELLRLEQIDLIYSQVSKGPESKQFKDTLINTLKVIFI